MVIHEPDKLEDYFEWLRDIQYMAKMRVEQTQLDKT